MRKIDWEKFGKAASISGGILIAFVANKWFEQAWAQPWDFVKWGMIVIAMIFIAVAIYINMPN